MIVAITAICRAQIFEETITSLKQFLMSKEPIKIILNVDPVGVGRNGVGHLKNKYQNNIVDIAKKYFSDVIYNTPETASFEAACIWLWNQVDEPYFLHWEDDCQLLKNIKCFKIIDLMDKYDNISSYRFHDAPIKSNTNKVFGPSNYINDGKFDFHLSQNWFNNFGTGPSFIKTKFIKDMLPLLHLEKNMEKQFRCSSEASSNKQKQQILKKWRIAWCVSDTPMWKELGVPWRIQHKISKVKDGSPLRYIPIQ